MSIRSQAIRAAHVRARYNIAPMSAAFMVRSEDSLPVACTALWGLIPSLAKDAKIAASCINARSETAAEKPAFRSAFKKRRCLIPADGFFEWERRDKVKLPWRFVRPDGSPFFFAGLWEAWHPPTAPESCIETFTILTTTPNAVVAPIHDRMPVILDASGADRWLAEPDAS